MDWGLSLQAPEPLSIAGLLPAPNPARGPVTLRWRLTQAADRGSLGIYDTSGARVKKIVLPAAGAGTGQTVWDGSDRRGQRQRQGSSDDDKRSRPGQASHGTCLVSTGVSHSFHLW